MKYFFLSILAITGLVIGVFGFRGEKFARTPIEIFPDMDRMDFVQSQEPSRFFHDGMGARLPVKGTIPHASDDGIFPVEFSEGRTGHYYTGAIDDYFANGLPKEQLELKTPQDVATLLRRGQDRFGIFCAICHGDSGEGNGMVSRYMVAKVANLNEPRFASDQYPDGRAYHVITHGQGLMSGYGANLPVRDRWAIVAYLRALQDSKKAPAVPETPAPGAGADPQPAGGAAN